jgi:hypothetical protein
MKSNLQDTLYATGAVQLSSDWFTNERHWRHTTKIFDSLETDESTFLNQ